VSDEELEELEAKIDLTSWIRFKNDDYIGFPDFHGDSKVMKSLKGQLICCGGGRDECLAEMLLYFDVLGLRYKSLTQFIY
jgi:hypothetical protein